MLPVFRDPPHEVSNSRRGLQNPCLCAEAKQARPGKVQGQLHAHERSRRSIHYHVAGFAARLRGRRKTDRRAMFVGSSRRRVFQIGAVSVARTLACAFSRCRAGWNGQGGIGARLNVGALGEDFLE